VLRHTDFTLPRVPFVPGRGPHPNRDPSSAGWRRCAGPPPADFRAADWRRTPRFLYAVDLFNHGFYWETHEMLEGLWLAAGRTTPEGRFLQGLIQVAAGILKEIGGEGAGAVLLAAGTAKLERAGDRYMGVDVAGLLAALAGREYRPGGAGIAIELAR